jgi:hypothetical protein
MGRFPQWYLHQLHQLHQTFLTNTKVIISWKSTGVRQTPSGRFTFFRRIRHRAVHGVQVPGGVAHVYRPYNGS